MPRPDKAARAESPYAPPGVAQPDSSVLQDMNQGAPPD